VPTKTSTTLAPVEIKVRTTPSGTRIFIRDLDSLVDQAMSAYNDKMWRDAAELLEIVTEEFPDAGGIGPVHFNAGLSWLRLKSPERAERHFREAVRAGIGSRDARDAVFMLANSLAKQKRYRRAAQVYGAMLDNAEVIRIIGGKLGTLDQLEASARQGLLLRKAKDIHGASRAFRYTQRVYDRYRDLRPVAESEWIVRAYYERGEIYRELFESIRFKLPVARMQRDLEDKANLFFRAQRYYFRAVRLHDKKWSLAAGFHIGNLYARLIDDIDAAEVPEGLDSSTVSIYKEDLLKHTAVLAKKALKVFEKNVALAKRLGVTGTWIERSEQQLKRMRTLLKSSHKNPSAPTP
tara:strand:- start:50 stop:1099 length:1050 start_codon:yes stop_codon:yes gene_type:complete